jgi:hypothetical protein
MEQVALTLENLCEGSLHQQFLALYPDLIAKCASGEKASMTISIEFERVPDTATMVRTTYTLKTKTPGYGKASICQMDSNYNLKTEEVYAPPEPVSLFTIKGGQE